MMKIFICIVFLSVGAAKSFGNDTIANNRPNIWIMGVPQHLFENGLRVEVDKRLRNPANWITFSPVLYYRRHEPDASGWFGNPRDFETMFGGGLSVYIRHYPNHDRRFRGFYLMTGGGYEIISYKQSGFGWEEVQRDGLYYYVPGQTMLYNSQIHSFHFRACIGYKFQLDPNLAVDIFLGPGLRYSNRVSPGDATIVFDRTLSRGFEGTHLAAGIRFGVGW